MAECVIETTLVACAEAQAINDEEQQQGSSPADARVARLREIFEYRDDVAGSMR
jgi:hypothetical protein